MKINHLIYTSIFLFVMMSSSENNLKAQVSVSDEIWFYANSKIYEAKLSQLEKPVVVFNRNINDFTRINYPYLGSDNYIAVSRDTIGLKSKLYLLKLNPPSIYDSIDINGYAKGIAPSF